jgi:hypothetical protein
MEGEDSVRDYYAAYFEAITVHKCEGRQEPIREGYGFNVAWGKNF